MPAAHQAYHPQGQAPQPDQLQGIPAEPGRELLAFEAGYNQPPQVPLGGQVAPAGAPQDFFEADRGDADFMDENLAAPEMASKKIETAECVAWTQRRNGRERTSWRHRLGRRSCFRIQAERRRNGRSAPLVTADSSPVKAAPDQPGGKEFSHKNKLIYDRLTNGAQPQNERLVPRQEDIAVPALPAAGATAGLPAAAMADPPPLVPQTTAARARSRQWSFGPTGPLKRRRFQPRPKPRSSVSPAM